MNLIYWDNKECSRSVSQKTRLVGVLSNKKYAKFL